MGGVADAELATRLRFRGGDKGRERSGPGSGCDLVENGLWHGFENLYDTGNVWGKWRGKFHHFFGNIDTAR
jgi:hypothetical protein